MPIAFREYGDAWPWSFPSQASACSSASCSADFGGTRPCPGSWRRARRHYPGRGIFPSGRTAQEEFGDIGTRIEESAKTIDGITDVNKARKEIEALRTIVGGLLGAVSDNGVVAQLGDRALQHGRDKLKTLAEDNRFTREERDFLIKEWGQLVEQTERASGELGNARKEFVQLLRVLQTREDFIDELLQIRRAAEAVNVIRKLTQEIRDASEKLKELMRAIKPPGV